MRVMVRTGLYRAAFGNCLWPLVGSLSTMNRNRPRLAVSPKHETSLRLTKTS
jgi:hypothetical protein